MTAASDRHLVTAIGSARVTLETTRWAIGSARVTLETTRWAIGSGRLV